MMKSSLILVAVFFLNVSVSFSQTALLTNIEDLSSTFTLDMRYATTNNFLEEKLYDCGSCLLLPETAKALNQANHYFNAMGYRIKIWDCYRPLDVQVKMFAKVPNPMYVADPKEGSIHNRGGAVDLTLETLDGKELDMGTDHDHFGREAHIDNFDLPEVVLNNRKILETGMKQFGFQTIQSEWWHFNHSSASGEPVMNEPLPCE
jgi:D-alanyl-D-alanine dipeptidase